MITDNELEAILKNAIGWDSRYPARPDVVRLVREIRRLKQIILQVTGGAPHPYPEPNPDIEPPAFKPIDKVQS